MFTDFKEERTLLNKHIFPEISQYCLRNNIDLEFIDLHLGVTKEQLATVAWQEFFRSEIKRCKNNSYGPCFVVCTVVSK